MEICQTLANYRKCHEMSGMEYRAEVSHVASMVTEGIGSLGNQTRSLQGDLNKLLEEEKELKAEVPKEPRTRKSRGREGRVHDQREAQGRRQPLTLRLLQGVRAPPADIEVRHRG